MPDELTPISDEDARSLANEHGATRLLIFAMDDDGNYACTTAGKTRRRCDALRRWVERHGEDVAMSIDLEGE